MANPFPSPSRSGIFLMNYTAGGGFEFPTSSTTSHPPLNPFTSNGLTVGGVFQTVLRISCPALSANTGQILNGSTAITSFPVPLQLNSGSTGLIVPSAVLVTPTIQANLIVGVPSMIVNIGGLVTPTLTGGRTYPNPTINLTVNAFAVNAATTAVSLNFSVSAVLYGTTS
jgi:hypothetical protein